MEISQHRNGKADRCYQVDAQGELPRRSVMKDKMKYEVLPALSTVGSS
jgi:hypothetical protein